MKTLYIIRHAKSSWDFPQLSDEERPLLEKGIRRTLKSIYFLKQQNVFPDLMISSHAKRAFETTLLMAKGLDYPVEKIITEPTFYSNSAEEMIDFIFGLPDDKQHVFMVGHNPTFTNLANEFLSNKIDFLPTSAIVAISFDVNNWNEIIDSKHKLVFTVYPKKL